MHITYLQVNGAYFKIMKHPLITIAAVVLVGCGEKLTKLAYLYPGLNPDLTKAQIAELQKALPKCKIGSSPKK